MIKRSGLIVLILLSTAVILQWTACSKDEETNENPTPEVKLEFKEVRDIQASNVIIEWKAYASALGYEFDVSTNATFESFVGEYQAKDVFNNKIYALTGLEENTTYYVRARAYMPDKASYSPYCDTYEFTTNSNKQIINSGFEEWITYPNYEEPAARGVWATANKIVDLLPGTYLPTAEKSTDAHSGNYALKVFTVMQPPPTNLLAAGSCSIGIFNVDLGNPANSLKQGMPFTEKPSALNGYYKYISVDGDSCRIMAELTHWDTALGERVLVAKAELDETNYPTDYTAFSIPFNYFTQDNPDSIFIVLASSAGGETFQGSVGSTLYIDDISLGYE